MRRSGWVRGLLSVAALALLALPAPAAAYRSVAGDRRSRLAPLAVAQHPGAERFSLDYEQSCRAFRADVESARQRGFPVESGEILVPSKMFGDNALSIPWALYAPRQGRTESQSVLVSISGVHGQNEGAAGAALEAATVARLETLEQAQFALLNIHAYNAFGYRTGRRVAEGGEDCLRNCRLEGDDLFAMENQGYDDLRGALEPPGEVRNPRLEGVRVAAGILGSLFRTPNLKANIAAQQQAIAGGQFRWRKGMFFGGQEPVPQLEGVRRVVTELTALFKMRIFADLHTGFGPARGLQVITEDEVSEREAAALVGSVPADSGILLASDPRAGGIYKPEGTLISFLREQLTPEQRERSVLLGLEFGTIGASLWRKLQTIAIMVLENKGWHHGYATAEAKETVERWFAELFNPSDPVWQAGVLRQHAVLLDAILDRYGTPAGGSPEAAR